MMIGPYAVTVAESNMPIDNDTLVLNEIFEVKTSLNSPETTKFMTVFTRERFPLHANCTLCTSCHFEPAPSLTTKYYSTF